MRCIRCQSEIKQGDAFCTKCGEKVYWQQAPVQQPLTQQVQYQQNMYVEQQMMNNAVYAQKKKSKIKPVLIGLLSLVMIVGMVFFLIGIFADDKETVSDNNEDRTTSSITEKETDGHNGDENGGENKKVKHTIMIYAIGSDLETNNKAATLDIQEMMRANYGDDIKIVLQTGGALKWWTNGIEGGKVQRFEVKTGEIIELDNLGKVNMALESTLSDFITFASKKYAAEKYTLVLWDHGGGAPIGFGKDENFNGTGMADAQIGLALKAANVKFESVVMDACNMCTLEVAMAVKDYAKYMVAAESYTVGIGLNYESWLNYMEKNPYSSGAEYGEVLVMDYMDSLEQIDYPASMSSINLSKIDKVYDAYVDYMESVYEKIKARDYVNYNVARNNCGIYEGTDSVDIITLASKYKTDKSDALITSVVNAVGHTESDFLYGHGLAAYSPYEKLENYSLARRCMEITGYDKSLVECYDAFVSISLAYLGQSYVTQYAGEWYNENIVSQYVESGTQSGEYLLATEIIDGNNVINANNINWNTLSSIEAMMYMFLDDKNIIMLGNDYYYEQDKYGNIRLDVPKNWVYINGYIAPYICVERYNDESSGKWMELGTVFARCNGQDIVILIKFDDENPSGKIGGYMYFDFDKLSETEYGERVFEFEENDVIELIYPVINGETEEVKYENISGEQFLADALSMAYAPINLSESKIACTYTVYDIYGNTYETDMILYE